MSDSEIQELSESPRAIGEAHKKNYFPLILNVVCILVILWLARGWLLRTFPWLNGDFQKEIAKRLGISSGAVGFVYFLMDTGWSLLNPNTKKKQKRAEEEKKQFNPRYNPIAEQDSESWKP